MAIYEYKCKTCDSKFEMMRGMREEQPAPCPACGGKETMRLLSLFAAQSKDREVAACEAGAACGTSERLGVPCCGGGCALN